MQRLHLQLRHLAPRHPTSTTESDRPTNLLADTATTTTATATATVGETQGPKFPFPDNGGYAQDGRATATCYCGAIQLAFPTEGKYLVDTFICNCTDCRKITASMFASNFIIASKAVEHLRGQDKLSEFSQNKTIASGNTMTNYFCSVCGTLMYRVSSGFPNNKILRIGTVDDFSLHETKLKPRLEQFGKDRVSWFKGGEGVKQEHGNYYH